MPSFISISVSYTHLAKMMIPLIKYIITKNEDFIIKTAMYMTNGEDIIDEDTKDILKDSRCV